MAPQSGLKEKLYKKCQKIIEGRINSANEAIEAARSAANAETKSSAGDKYETGRAMMQLEQERLSVQLSEALKLKKTLDQTKPDQANKDIALGSLAITNHGSFYISVSLGAIDIVNKTYMAISLATPIGKQLNGKKAQDDFVFNGRQYTILEVY
ncbi:MAG: 3-oxoacyl-ACP synthase [Bacteroidota bacterium]